MIQLNDAEILAIRQGDQRRAIFLLRDRMWMGLMAAAAIVRAEAEVQGMIPSGC